MLFSLLHVRSNSQLSSSPTSSTLEHKPSPAAQSKVHDLARRYSAMAKSGETLALPVDSKPKGGSFGRSEGSKISGLMGKFKESATIAESVPKKAPSMPLTTPKKTEIVNVAEPVDMGEVDIEQEIESSLQVSEQAEQAEQVQLAGLVDVPLGGDRGEDRDLD
ncbi:hypothetical protein BGZ74_000929 [Mortierella antarctica]|nr:hypothetical protein BGZ74_000929 [Mortierella antarctica]